MPFQKRASDGGAGRAECAATDRRSRASGSPRRSYRVGHPGISPIPSRALCEVLDRPFDFEAMKLANRRSRLCGRQDRLDSVQKPCRSSGEAFASERRERGEEDQDEVLDDADEGRLSRMRQRGSVTSWRVSLLQCEGSYTQCPERERSRNSSSSRSFRPLRLVSSRSSCSCGITVTLPRTFRSCTL